MTAKNGNLFARYALEKNKITKSKRVKPKLFEPKKDGTLSVQKIDSLNKHDIQATGNEVAKERNKSLYGWAKITRSVFEGLELMVCIDNNPRPGHTTISGWPKEREVILDIQKLLASASKGVLI